MANLAVVASVVQFRIHEFIASANVIPFIETLSGAALTSQETRVEKTAQTIKRISGIENEFFFSILHPTLPFLLYKPTVPFRKISAHY
jgi:hypothetical protein